MNQNQQRRPEPQRPQRPLNARELLIKNRKQVALALELLFASGYISRKRLYWENFMRGIFFAVGTIVGITIGVGALVWVLSLFDQIPLIGPVIENITDQINSAKTGSDA